MIQDISTVDRLCEFSHESWSGIRQIQIVKAPCTDIQEEKKLIRKKWIAMNTSFIKNAFTMLYVLKCSGFPASYF